MTYIPSGNTTTVVRFVPLFSGARVPALTSGWTVKRKRGANAPATMTSPTITEISGMAGVYELLVDEDTTISAGLEFEQVVYSIEHADHDDVTVEATIYAVPGVNLLTIAGTDATTYLEGRTLPSNQYLQPTVAGRTLDVTAGGCAGIDWGNVEDPTAEVELLQTVVAGLFYALPPVTIGDVDALGKAGVRAALGMSAANLDTQFSGLNTKLGETEDDSIVERLAAIRLDTGTTLPGLVSGVAAQTYTKDRATPKRTWHFTPNTESATSPNTITESASFDGEVFFDLTNALNPGAGILSITSVTVSPAGPTIGDAAKTSDQLKVAVPVSDHEAGKTYTYTITVSTTDGDNALVRKGRFVAE